MPLEDLLPDLDDRTFDPPGRVPHPGRHVAPVLLGDGIRLFDNPGGDPVRLAMLNADDPSAEVNVRYRPLATT